MNESQYQDFFSFGVSGGGDMAAYVGRALSALLRLNLNKYLYIIIIMC